MANCLLISLVLPCLAAVAVRAQYEIGCQCSHLAAVFSDRFRMRSAAHTDSVADERWNRYLVPLLTARAQKAEEEIGTAFTVSCIVLVDVCLFDKKLGAATLAAETLSGALNLFCPALLDSAVFNNLHFFSPAFLYKIANQIIKIFATEKEAIGF